MAGHAGKIAVITGGASGIGYAIAERAGAEGMTVVLVDVEAPALADAAARLASAGVAVHAFEADVVEARGRWSPSRSASPPRSATCGC